MKTVAWIQTWVKMDGGNIYEQLAIKALAADFELELFNVLPKYFTHIKFLKIPELILRLSRIKGEKNLWIRDFFSTISLGLDKTIGKNLVMFHHIDFSTLPLVFRPFFFILEKIFYQKCKKADAIVTVSEYWRNNFLNLGYKNVYKIYNSFDLSEFDMQDQEILEFKREHGLGKKPIVYIGNCQRAKGVVESYRALKSLNIHLVTSGEQRVKIPALNLKLEYRDYLRLLKASSVVVTMSLFKEGWCRTAHEAMLCKTPVVGSGKGGMRELLEGGGQIVSQDFGELKNKVKCLLEHPEIRNKMAEKGYNFAKSFTFDKFKEDWISLIKKICAE